MAADIETGDAVVLGEGMLHDAIRASAAIPILFAPVKLKGRLLVDGGIANNLPVSVAKAMGSDIVIAVDASAKPISKENLTSLFSVMSQTITLQVQRGARREAALADIVILPDTSAYSFSDFPKIKEIVVTGERAARAALPAIRRFLRKNAGAPFHITGLTIKGNARVTDAIIRTTMAASLRSLRATRDDIHAAMATLFNLGHFSDITAGLVKVRGGYPMVLTVVENPVVRDVQITGNQLIPTEEIRSAVSPVVGKTLNITELSAALTTIVDRYREKGYRLVRVARAGMGKDNKTLGITLYEGPVTSVRLEGQKRTKPSLFRREIRTGPGDPLNFNTLIRDVRHFYGLGYYESLNIKMQEGADGGVELAFHVKEKPTGRVRLGMRYDLEDSFTGLTDIQVKNWTGRDIRLYLNTRYGSYTDIRLGYHAPIFLSANFIHTLQAFYYQRDYAIHANKKQTSEKDVSRTGADFAVGYQGFKFGDTYLRYRYTSDRTREGLGPAQSETTDQIGSLALLMTIDTRDSNTFAHRGLLFRGSYETAAPAYGGDRSFRKTSLLAQSSIPLGKRHTVALEANGGFGSGAIPYHEEFGIGGADYLLGFPLFGYERREFTGTNLLGFSLSYRWKMKEYQFKAVKAVYLSIAGQAANVWNSRDAMTFRDLRGGGGVGIHADTLVGPFRLDFGVGEDDRFRVYFSAGFDF
ncbi:MAG TPA: hypothetical protein DCO77_08595 [Nitrospiraceae bacterium]|nr:hypothetical protein [Nitrospiraceae bacterium]